MNIRTIQFKPGSKAHLNIRYQDKYLKRLFRNYDSSRLLYDMKSLSRFDLPKVTHLDLKENNGKLFYQRDLRFQGEGRGKYIITKNNNASMNTVIFSKGKSIRASALTCLSVMLHVKKMKIAAGIHLAAGGDKDETYIRNMFWYGFYNLKKLSGGNPITAYISGRHCYSADNSPRMNEVRSEMMKGTILLFCQLWPLIRNNGIKPIFIDLGGNYVRQELFVKTGKYRLHVQGNEPESEISS